MRRSPRHPFTRSPGHAITASLVHICVALMVVAQPLAATPVYENVMTAYECHHGENYRSILVRTSRAASKLPCAVVYYDQANEVIILFEGKMSLEWCKQKAKASIKEFERAGFSCAIEDIFTIE